MQVPKYQILEAALWTYGFQFLEGAPTLCCEIVSSLINPPCPPPPASLLRRSPALLG